MKKSKTQRGITLIALIITIVILLILAAVAISSIQNDGIIQYAKNAAISYNKVAQEESGMLDYYEAYLAGTLWRQDGATIKRVNEDGTITELKIGDYVNYIEGSSNHTPDISKGVGTEENGQDSSSGKYILTTDKLITEDLSWRVLGVNAKGQLELISADPTEQSLYLANYEGYVYAEENLNNFCNDLYGKGAGAKEARSLNVDDINKLSNYKSISSTYGVEYIYRYPTQEEMDATTGTTNSKIYMQYSTNGGLTWNDITSNRYQIFNLPEDAEGISYKNTGSRKVTNTYYSYDLLGNITAEDGFTSEEATEIAYMLGRGTNDSSVSQWLASKCANCRYVEYVSYEVRCVGGGDVTSAVMGYSRDFAGSISPFYTSWCFVRPVVTLMYGVTLSGSGDDIGSSNNMWQLGFTN